MPFSKNTLDFLVENKMRNSKDWYQANKDRYEEYVHAPLVELAERLSPVMREIDPLLTAPPKRCVSRIYRDTRFSKDKSLFRDVMWCVFFRDKNTFFCPPGFVLEFSPDGFRYGCGWWQAPPRMMEAVRKLILNNDRSFQAARKAAGKLTQFQFEGEFYKRSKYPDQPEDLRLWLDRKNIDFMHNSQDFELLYSDDLWKTLADGFRQLKPIYDFMNEAEALTRRV